MKKDRTDLESGRIAFLKIGESFDFDVTDRTAKERKGIVNAYHMAASRCDMKVSCRSNPLDKNILVVMRTK